MYLESDSNIYTPGWLDKKFIKSSLLILKIRDFLVALTDVVEGC